MTDSSLEGPTQGSPRADASLDRLKVWIGLSKFVIGTLAVGVLTTVLDCSYRNAQLKLQEKQSASALALQEKQAEFDYLSKFIEHAMDEDLRVRIRLASYMTSVALSDNIKGIWERYHAELLRQANDFDARLDVLERQETEKVVVLRQTPRLRRRHARS